MVALRRILMLLLVALIFVAGVFLGARMSGWLGLRSGPRFEKTPALLQQVQTLSELVTVKYVIEKAEVWNDPPQNILSRFVAGDNHILLLAHGVVKAGVDLSRLKPQDLEVRGKTLFVHLPPAQVTDAYLDDKETKVVERTTGFLRSFDKDLEQNIRQTAVQDIRSAAWHGGILKDADERARTQLAVFFLKSGFEKVEFSRAAPDMPLDFHVQEK